VSIGIVLQIVYKNDMWRRDEIRRNQLFLSQHARTLKAQDLAHRAAEAKPSDRFQNTAELVATIADLRLNHDVISHGSYKGDTPRAGILTSQADATRVPWYLDPPSAASGYEQAFDALKGPTVQPDGLYDQLARLGDLLAEDTPDQTAIDETLTTIDERVDEAAEIYSTASPDLIRNFTETDRLRTQVVLVTGIGLVAAMIILFTVFNSVMQRRRLAWAESHDPLTGLGNRERFSRSVASALRSRETNGVMAILLIDLDSFAELNRVYGAAQGDAILSIVASRLASQLRDSDVAARLGGDVFAVGCGRVDDPLVARSLGQRLGQVLKEPIQLDRKNEIRLTATIGIDVLKNNTITLDDSLDNCRLAVRSAKRDAPGAVELFSQSLKDSEAAEAQLQEELRRAIDFGELVVFYQPEVNLATGEIIGSEALVRWVHPQHGLIPPTVFIPLAEKTGLIVDLGAYVLIEACRQAGEWVRAYPELVLKMRVNLSARQLESPAIVDLVSQALDISGLEPSRLCLEITESALMTDAESSRKLLERLASLGIRLAIDDFGTGYSSLAYLEQFPVDVLKSAGSHRCPNSPTLTPRPPTTGSATRSNASTTRSTPTAAPSVRPSAWDSSQRFRLAFSQWVSSARV
jgi:diguanylate cyclase (GGDEF)-like protein